MSATVAAVDRKVPATAGTSSQLNLRIHSEAPPPKAPQLLTPALLAGASFSRILAFALMHAGMEQGDAAREVHVSAGYMSRFVSELGEQWAKRLVRFMVTTGCLGPLQWLAEQVGCDLVQRDVRAAELAAAKARVAELERSIGAAA